FPHMIMVVVIMTERYKTVLAKGAADRNKLLFKSLAVYDRKVAEAGAALPAPEGTSGEEAKTPTTPSAPGFAIDKAVDEPDEDDDDDLVLTAFELLDIDEAV